MTHKPIQRLASTKPGSSLLKSVGGAAFARLLAQAYIRNGMVLGKAYTELTGTTSHSLTAAKMTRGHMDEFVDEIRVQLANADIDLERVLAQLWTMLQTSVLDFIGDDGRTLPVSELKKLPRCVQAVITAISVNSTELPVKDDAGNVLLDGNGRPYLRLSQKVQIKLPNKLDAISQLAALMKWTAPASITINTINIGATMATADDRRRRLEQCYAIDATTLRPDTADPAA